MHMNHTPVRALKITVSVFSLLAAAQLAHASLDVSYQFNGNGAWSLNGVGSNDSPVGNITEIIPEGSHIEKAFLYSSVVSNGYMNSVSFQGTNYSVGDFTSLGMNGGGIQAYRLDVTSVVQSVVGAGGASPFTFTVNSEDPNYNVDGEALAIVYSNPSAPVSTIAFLDGFSQPAGDNFTVNLANPLDTTTEGFQALMSLGIGYSYQSGSQQYSNVSVNGRSLTHSAGGEDDGQSYNGGLITIGGIGDDPSNPLDPNATPTGPRSDDELYNLALGNGVNAAPFLTNGLTSFTVNTDNPSDDDNIFFAGIDITARAGVNQPPPPPNLSGVPEPSTYGLFGAAALIGVGLLRRRRIKE